MKKMNKKGFTIVELVIVIAVIAILAGVLIPTFSGIINKAQESAAKQEAAAAYKEAYALALSDGKITDGEKYEAGKFEFTFGADESCEVKLLAGKEFGYAFTVVDGAVNIAEGTTPAVDAPAAPVTCTHEWGVPTVDGETKTSECSKCHETHTCSDNNEDNVCDTCGQ